MPVAHVGHVELRVTDLERSRWFFTEILGLFVSDEDDERVYLRAWRDWDHHTLIIKQAEDSGLEHVGWRVEAPEDLPAFERRFKDMGLDHHWVEGGSEIGQGDGLRFLTPAGVPMELYWEREIYKTYRKDPELESKLPSHPQKFTGRGIAPSRFDHYNCLINDVAAEQRWLNEVLGIHHRYYLEADGGNRLGSWMSRTNISHEVALMRNRNQSGTFLHHTGYYADSADQMTRAATLLADNGIRLEWGPGQHATSGAIFLYCFEPSGHRIEVWTSGFLIFAPDWEPIRWDPDVASFGLELWGSDLPDTYLTYGTGMGAGKSAELPEKVLSVH